MSPCPSESVLRELLDEHLEGRELEELVTHIETCADCQERLEQLTRGLGGKTTQKDLLARIDARDEPTDGPTAEPGSEPDALEFRLADVGEEGGRKTRGGGSTDQETTDHSAAGLGRTLTQGGPSGVAFRSVAGRSRADWPRVPGYEVIEQLGEGGMGVVYKARQSGLNRLVALKMIRDGSQARRECVRAVLDRGRGGRKASPSQHPADFRHW